MAGGRKTINRKFVLYSEALLEDYKSIRVFVILTHLLILILGIVGIIIGVFAYTASDAIPSVNCTQSVQFQSGVEFPVQLQLILTGIVLIAMDVGISLLLFAIKKLSCGTVAIVWFLTSTLLVTVWGGWSIAYAVLVYPLWNADRDSCDELVMISMLVGVALVAAFMLLYWIIALVTMVYDCWYRCDLECECSCRRRRNEFGDF